MCELGFSLAHFSENEKEKKKRSCEWNCCGNVLPAYFSPPRGSLLITAGVGDGALIALGVKIPVRPQYRGEERYRVRWGEEQNCNNANASRLISRFSGRFLIFMC